MNTILLIVSTAGAVCSLISILGSIKFGNIISAIIMSCCLIVNLTVLFTTIIRLIAS